MPHNKMKKYITLEKLMSEWKRERVEYANAAASYAGRLDFEVVIPCRYHWWS